VNDLKRSSGLSWGLLILRVGAGALLLYGHGWGKLVNFSQYAATFPDPLGVGSPTSLGLVVFAEVFCSIGIMLGLFTRFTLVPLLVFTGVAAFVHHAADPWPKKELALLYAVPFVTLMIAGPGRFSLDAVLARFRKRRPG